MDATTERELRLHSSIARSRSFVESSSSITPLAAGITIKFENVTYKVGSGKKEKIILDNLSGSVPQGCMVALMGASGSGKTTLLNVLSRRNRRNNGRVLFNGQELDDRIVSRILAYVQQDDIFFGTLTVREHLMIQARLRLGASVSKEERQQRVESIMKSLGLLKCSDSKIGNITMSEGRGISGGEKKRLNIATELLMAPSVIFADEVSTGLDSFVAYTAIQALRQFADLGRTVVCTIHQPSSKIFNMFDKVMLLSAGRTVYFGDRVGAQAWFSRLGHDCPPETNPAEFLIKIIATSKAEEIDHWCATWKETGATFIDEWSRGLSKSYTDSLRRQREDVVQLDENEKPVTLAQYSATVERINKQLSGSVDASHPKPQIENAAVVIDRPKSDEPPPTVFKVDKRINIVTEMATLTYRSFLVDKRNALLLALRMLQLVTFGLVLGFIYFRLGWSATEAQTKLGATYVMLMNQSLMNAMTVTNRVPLDLPVVRQEYRAGAIRIPAYVWGRMLSDVPIQFFSTFCFAVVAYWLVDYNAHFERFVLCVVIVILTSFAATSYGYWASCLASTVQVALSIVQAMLLPMVLTAGFAVRLKDIPNFWVWLKYISVLRFGFGSMARAVFFGETIHLGPGLPDIPAEQLLDQMDLNTSMNFFRWSIGALVIITLVVRVFASMSLTIRMRLSKSR